jgi:hypothetical protein
MLTCFGSFNSLTPSPLHWSDGLSSFSSLGPFLQKCSSSFDLLVLIAVDPSSFSHLLCCADLDLAHCCLALSLLWLICTLTTILVHCRPIQHIWKLPLENPQYSLSVKPFTLFSAVFGLVLDATIWSLPHFVVWNLQLRLTHKVAITAIFAIGLLCDLFRLLIVAVYH